MDNFCKRNFSILEGYIECFFFIVALLLLSNPLAVIRTVIPIVINSLDGHILIISTFNSPFFEGKIASVPFFANRYSSPAISVIVFHMWVFASCFHSRPNTMKSLFRIRFSGELICGRFTPFYFFNMSTILASVNASSFKVVNANFSCIPAIAFAKPNPAMRNTLASITNGNKIAKTFICYIFSFSHDAKVRNKNELPKQKTFFLHRLRKNHTRRNHPCIHIGSVRPVEKIPLREEQ